jgi:hypothetical protein
MIITHSSPYLGQMCPVARRTFVAGDDVTVCPTCQIPYLTESLLYLGGQCPVCGIPLVEGAPGGERLESEPVSTLPLQPTRVVAPPKSGAWLHLIDRNRQGISYPLSENGRTTIGRSGSNDIVLDSPFVSAEHAVVKGDRDVFIIHDLASFNGTWVNGHRVQRSILYDGDLLTFGKDLSLVFKQIRENSR